MALELTKSISVNALAWSLALEALEDAQDVEDAALVSLAARVSALEAATPTPGPTPTPTPPATIPAPTVTITGTPRVNDINFTGTGTGLNPDDGLQLDYGTGFKTLNGSFQFENDNSFLLDENMPAAGSYDFVFRVVRRYENEALLSQPIYGTATAPIAVNVQAVVAAPTPTPPPTPQFANQTARRYARYTVTAIGTGQSPGVGYSQISELGFRETETGPNLIGNATLTATSEGFGYVVGNVADGNVNTYHHTGTNTLPESITADFGAASSGWRKINVIDITSRADDYPAGAPTAGKLEVSDDGVNWITIAEWTGVTWVGSGQTKTFIGAKA